MGEASGAGALGRLSALVRTHILGLEDTPHRVAFGVFLGFLVGATPTIGLQMIIYVALATVLRANRLSGILPVWLSNPLTAVPLYYGEWRVGRALLRSDADAPDLMSDALDPSWADLLTVEFWTEATDVFVALGLELWVGSLLCGTVAGALGYFATRALIRRFGRRSHPAANLDRGPPS